MHSLPWLSLGWTVVVKFLRDAAAKLFPVEAQLSSQCLEIDSVVSHPQVTECRDASPFKTFSLVVLEACLPEVPWDDKAKYRQSS